MAINTCRTYIPINSISVTVLTLCCAVFTYKRITCLTVIKLCRIPCVLTMALGTGYTAELVEVRVNMALVAVFVDLSIFAFCLVTAYAENIVMNTS